MNSKMKLTYIISILLVIVIVAVIAVYFFKNKKENFDNNTPKLQIALFKAEWCGHCTNYLKSNVFNDAYTKAKDQYPGVVFITYDFDSNKELASKYNVNSFPTIIAVDSDGKYLTKFNGDRTNTDELVKFVKDNMQAI